MNKRRRGERENSLRLGRFERTKVTAKRDPLKPAARVIFISAEQRRQFHPIPTKHIRDIPNPPSPIPLTRDVFDFDIYYFGVIFNFFLIFYFFCLTSFDSLTMDALWVRLPPSRPVFTGTSRFRPLCPASHQSR